MSSDTSASVRPTSGIVARLQLARPPGRPPGPRARSWAISSASFTARSGDVTVEAATQRRRREPLLEGQQRRWPRPGPRSPTRAVRPPSRPTATVDRVLGLGPGAKRERPRPLGHPGGLEAGNDEDGVAVAGGGRDTVSRSRGMAR